MARSRDVGLRLSRFLFHSVMRSFLATIWTTVGWTRCVIPALGNCLDSVVFTAIEIPKDKALCLITYLEFEDGKLVGEGPLAHASLEMAPGPYVNGLTGLSP